MSTIEIFVIILGLYCGYWIISKLISPKLEAQKQTSSAEPANEGCNLAPWYITLNVPSDAGVEEIRCSYKILMSQYHPDKVASLGEELKVLAERKSKEIVTAYRYAMKLHGASKDT
ncbi:DnaJ like chaperone protein [Nitrosospira multiformis]|uniref:DnaJ like chaperone protein n=1 Tax=Nitrosospira multiformis TaxID=1231 RepID=A0A1H8MLS1_9PROT|nr:DnaJ domain-containing protein [Nitrosospira multiformis]SEO18325.1 DnaJ like chaperone protein [Nitrosospira multiformis]